MSEFLVHLYRWCVLIQANAHIELHPSPTVLFETAIVEYFIFLLHLAFSLNVS